MFLLGPLDTITCHLKTRMLGRPSLGKHREYSHKPRWQHSTYLYTPRLYDICHHACDLLSDIAHDCPLSNMVVKLNWIFWRISINMISFQHFIYYINKFLYSKPFWTPRINPSMVVICCSFNTYGLMILFRVF